jgi:hypothetical protein
VNWAKDLRSCSNIHVSVDLRYTLSTLASNCHLLKDQTIDANPRFWMNDNSVGVIDEQAAPYAAIQWDIGTGHYTPNPVTQDKPFANNGGERPSFVTPILISANRQQKLSARIPQLAWLFTTPIGNLSANMISVTLILALAHRLILIKS